MGDHQHALGAGRVVGPAQRAAQVGLHAEHVEELSRDGRAAQVARRSVLEHAAAPSAVIADARDALEQPALSPDGVDLARSERPVGERPRGELLPGDDQPVLVPNRERAQQHALYEREHHAGSGHAERQREHRRGREGLRSA
jgi:hypothetical protein